MRSFATSVGMFSWMTGVVALLASQRSKNGDPYLHQQPSERMIRTPIRLNVNPGDALVFDAYVLLGGMPIYQKIHRIYMASLFSKVQSIDSPHISTKELQVCSANRRPCTWLGRFSSFNFHLQIGRSRKCINEVRK